MALLCILQSLTIWFAKIFVFFFLLSFCSFVCSFSITSSSFSKMPSISLCIFANPTFYCFPTNFLVVVVVCSFIGVAATIIMLMLKIFDSALRIRKQSTNILPVLLLPTHDTAIPVCMCVSILVL